MDIARCCQIFSGCGGVIFFWLPVAPWAWPSCVGCWQIPSGLGCSRVTVATVPARISCCYLVRVHEEPPHILVFALLGKPSALRLVIIIESVTARSLDRILTISLVVDQLHQTAECFWLQTPKLFTKITPEETALESVDYQLVIQILTCVLDLGPSIDVIS